MIDLETLLQPVLDDAPEPPPFAAVRARASALHRRRVARAVVGAVVALGLVVGAVAAVATRNDRPRVTISRSGQSQPRLQIGAPTQLPGPAMDMIAAFGSIWVSQPDRVARLDPATGAVTGTVAVPGTSDFRNLATGAGALWVDDTGTETVTRIDPVHNRVSATIPMHENVLIVDGVAFVDGKLWIVRPAPNDDSHGDIVAIDPATNRVAEHATIPRTSYAMAAGAHALWYVRGTDLLRFDTRSLRTTVVRHDVKAMLTAADQHMWLLTASGVIEADSRGGQIGPAIPVTSVVNLTATVTPGVVWLAAQPDSSTGGGVTPYDAATHRPLARPVPVGLPITAMTSIDGAVWVDAGGLTRIPFAR